MFVVILDERGIHRWVSDTVHPLTREDVIGKPAWAFLTNPQDVDEMQTRVARCIVIPEPQHYLTTCLIGDDEVTFAVHCEYVPGIGVVCVSRIVPSEVRALRDDDMAFLRAIGSGAKQRDLAVSLGIKPKALAARETRLEHRLGLESRAELVRVGSALR